MLKGLMAVAMLAAVAGCAGPPHWRKPEATAADFRRDDYECRVETYRLRDIAAQVECLRARGWRTVRGQGYVSNHT